MPYTNYDDTTLAESTTVTLTNRDVVLIRAALEFLFQSSSRHEHVHADIRQLLEKLPEVPPAS